jgi:uncharacterized membrane protein
MEQQKYFWNRPYFFRNILSTILLIISILLAFYFLVASSFNWFSTGPSQLESTFDIFASIITLISSIFAYIKYIKNHRNLYLGILIFVPATLLVLQYTISISQY